MPVVITAYDPHWPIAFERLRGEIAAVVGDLAIAIEHVGSTSVAGLAAKSIIDMTIVVADESDVPDAIMRLATIGYEHRGNLGVEGREAFSHPPHDVPHHLYLCPQRSLGLRNHLAVRDYLREHADAVEEYAQLKRRLAEEFPDDIERYIDGKTEFLLAILNQTELNAEDLRSIESSNRKEK